MFDFRAAALYLFLAYPQIQYFSGAGAKIVVLVAFSLFAISALTHQLRSRYSWFEWTIIALFTCMAFLAILLELFGGGSSTRFLPAQPVIALVMVLITFSAVGDKAFQRDVVSIFTLVMLGEFTLVLGQASYIQSGFGFVPPQIGEYSQFGITGSRSNPNNVATLVGLLAIVVSTYSYLTRDLRRLGFVMVISGSVALLTLSRTVLVALVTHIVLLTLVRSGRVSFGSKLKSKFIVVLTMVGLGGIFIWYAQSFESEFAERSLTRLASIQALSGDGSVGFRMIVLQRFIEALDQLGIGTFQDLAYHDFFRVGDDPLMLVNPHSLLVEYSFLFGYPGLVVVSLVFGVISMAIVSARCIPLLIRLETLLALVFLQAVPSSLLGEAYYFIPFLFLWASFGSREQRFQSARLDHYPRELSNHARSS